MSNNHAKLSASGSAQWINCPGSIKATTGIIGTSSVFAEEGSAAHELAEICLNGGALASELVGQRLVDWDEWTVTEEMAGYVQQYIDFVIALGGTQSYEIRSDFSAWVPDGFGTSDAVAYVADTKTLHVVDLKYGQGIRVDAENNSQGILYALGVFDSMSLSHEIERVVITIVQPRRDHIDEWTIDVDTLLKCGEIISQAADRALADDAPRIPGETQCRWCDAKATCPALLELTETTMMAEFDNLDAVPVDSLTDAQMALALDNKKLILSWFDAISQKVKDRLMSGQPFAGYKMVAGNRSRSWAYDDADVVNRLVHDFGVTSDDAYISKIVSPAQAEKLVGKKHAPGIASMIQTKEGAPTLVIDSDKRPAVNVSLDDFENLT
jgi:hypothetical protein